MDLDHQNNGDMNDEVHEIVNDAIIAATSLDASSLDRNELNSTVAAELSDDVEKIDGNVTPIIRSSPHNANENDSSAEQMDEVSNEKATVESTVDIDENKSLFRLEFENGNVYEELAMVISARVREALVSLNKTYTYKVDKENNRISFSKADDGDIFMIDTLPTDKVHKSEVPDYTSVTEALKKMNASKKAKANNLSDKSKAGGCWNCGGDHNMRECKEPMNRENISRGKQMFHRTKTERYHLDAEQKFAHFLPGTISEGLREALGLRQRELPLYIYKMRLYGYPPGWLEEAKVTHSGLTLFNSEVSQLDTWMCPQLKRRDFNFLIFIFAEFVHT